MTTYTAQGTPARRKARERGIGPANVQGVFSNMNVMAIKVRQERCAVVRNRNVNCLKCADACTSGCISLDSGVLSVDASKCVGCGTCATVCPTCALEARHPNDEELSDEVRRAAHDGFVAIACAPYIQACEGLLDTDRIAKVVCLGRVDESLLVGLAAKGIKDIALLEGICTMCDQAHGADCVRMVQESAMGLLGSWGSTTQVHVAQTAPERILATGATSAQASDALAHYFSKQRGNEPLAPQVANSSDSNTVPLSQPEQTVMHVMRDGTLPHFVPDRRERLLDALSDLGQPHTKTISNRLWGNIVIDTEICISCRMCATFCPTGAIRKFDNPDGSIGVQHFPGDCVKCGSCRDICPAKAITILDEVNSACILEGEVHKYDMRSPEMQPNDAHQILNKIRKLGKVPIFER